MVFPIQRREEEKESFANVNFSYNFLHPNFTLDRCSHRGPVFATSKPHHLGYCRRKGMTLQRLRVPIAIHQRPEQFGRSTCFKEIEEEEIAEDVVECYNLQNSILHKDNVINFYESLSYSPASLMINLAANLLPLSTKTLHFFVSQNKP
ncbi:hypothetical protein LXL04_033381 [Taraxacum kok-saghyz]